ncbi:MAG: hypothetical protein CMF53_04060 [Legionellales bacterium]|nr:hypothetical protein [Legionellales bacterium]HCU89616.1 hypothetical protein [Gammaproteobacteria bacterium]|tara:strand:- start:373 stop:1230 length:858 start_codon:yes stop_codon:yes gene_type:complete
MRPGPFQYSKPETLEQALQAILNGAVPLAGGQSLIQAMRLRSAEPTSIVDINAVADLSSEIECEHEVVKIGALATHRQLAEHPTIQREFPWLAKAATEIGDVQIRNRGTVLGNICWADPRANMAIALLACDAIIHATSTTQNGSLEQIPISDFFTGFRSNILGAQLAISIELERRPDTIGSYIEFSRQRQDLALCNVCVVHRNRTTAIAVGGIAQQPIRLTQLELLLRKQGLSKKLLATQIREAIEGSHFEAINDQFGSSAFKQQLAATLIQRAIAKCIDGGDHA